jgi:small subunit ribosomal protein S1
MTNTMTNTESNESFKDLLSEYEQAHSRKRDDGRKQLEGTVIAVSADLVFVDIGYKTEGVLPLALFQSSGEEVKPGDKFPVSVKGRNPEGYYELSRTRVELPKDWSALERAFAEKSTIMGTVTGVIKGGVTVDVGVRAFMPASRSGTKDAAELEKLVGQEIGCRIIKLDVADEDLVVDRRAVLEEEERSSRERRFGELKEGDVVSGTVRSLTDYGAFVDIGGVDALLHVSDIGWSRVNKPSDALSVGQQVEARVLKINNEGDKRRISIGVKQLQDHPWDAGAGKYKVGERVRGVVTKLMDFGAFVELEPGIEGLIHISELSWGKKVRKVGDVVKQGDSVEAVILGVNPADRRIALGLKQAMGDPWTEVAQRLSAGSVIEGPVTSLTNFGAFVQIAEGVEGMIHVSEFTADRRINHPQEVVKVGQKVQAQILSLDREKRLIKLSIKQMVPTSLDEYIAEHKSGDVVSGRLLEVENGNVRVELGQGIQATCRVKAEIAAKEETKPEGKADLSSLSSMLKAKWKGQGGAAPSKKEPVQAGQIRSFRISNLDADAKKIELELA